MKKMTHHFLHRAKFLNMQGLQWFRRGKPLGDPEIQEQKNKEMTINTSLLEDILYHN